AQIGDLYVVVVGGFTEVNVWLEQIFIISASNLDILEGIVLN
ncbi:hypothetical protein Csa_023744, partial [Cucumis sativus]